MARSQFALALHTLLVLARSPAASTSASLAATMNIHATGLRRVLSTLTRAGLVASTEGRDGGYRLALPASDITLADIYAALAGKPLLQPASFMVNTPCPLGRAMGQLMTEIAEDAEARVQESLARRTLADLSSRIDTPALS